MRITIDQNEQSPSVRTCKKPLPVFVQLKFFISAALQQNKFHYQRFAETIISLHIEPTITVDTEIVLEASETLGRFVRQRNAEQFRKGERKSNL